MSVRAPRELVAFFQGSPNFHGIARYFDGLDTVVGGTEGVNPSTLEEVEGTIRVLRGRITQLEADLATLRYELGRGS